MVLSKGKTLYISSGGRAPTRSKSARIAEATLGGARRSPASQRACAAASDVRHQGVGPWTGDGEKHARWIVATKDIGLFVLLFVCYGYLVFRVLGGRELTGQYFGQGQQRNTWLRLRV